MKIDFTFQLIKYKSLCKKHKIAVIVGSLRKESFNLKTAKAMMAMAPESFDMELLDISGLPMFNEDLEGNPPEEWETLRKNIKDADGLLFFTPEYNRSVPGVLKNAIDVGSRPYGQIRGMENHVLLLVFL